MSESEKSWWSIIHMVCECGTVPQTRPVSILPPAASLAAIVRVTSPCSTVMSVLPSMTDGIPSSLPVMQPWIKEKQLL